MYLIKINLDKSLVEIGRAFGGKDHTTVMHAGEKIAKQIDEKDVELIRQIQDIREMLSNS